MEETKRQTGTLKKTDTKIYGVLNYLYSVLNYRKSPKKLDKSSAQKHRYAGYPCRNVKKK